MALVDNGNFFDPVKAALQDVIGLYSQVEAIKLNNQLAKAKASAEAYALPSKPQDAQAIAQSTYDNGGASRWLAIGAGVAAVAALVYILSLHPETLDHGRD